MEFARVCAAAVRADRVVEKLLVNPAKSCLIRAWIFKSLTGYRMAGGSASWLLTDEDTGENMTHASYQFTPQPAYGLIMPEMHVWNVTPGGSVVDTSSAYFPAVAEENGLEWTRPPPPRFYFGQWIMTDQRDRVLAMYSEHPDATVLANMLESKLEERYGKLITG
jgi:hypothetical protein